MRYYRSSYFARVNRLVFVRAVALLGLGLSLWQCKSAGVDPNGGPSGPGRATAAEVAAINSTSPGVFMAGTYVATWLQWRYDYGNITEGNDWSYVADPAFIRGDYKLVVEAVAGHSDSVRVYLNGSGHGPDFKRTPVGTFWVGKGLDSGKRNDTYQTRYPVRDKYTIDDTPRIYFNRLALLDKTVFTFDIALTQYFSRSDGKLVFLVPDLAVSIDNILFQVFKPSSTFRAYFRRVSPALVKDPYKL